VSTVPGALKSLLDWTGNSQQHASLFSLRGSAGMRMASSTWCGLTPSCDAPGAAVAKEAEEYTDDEGDDEYDALPHDCRPGLPA
jgi:NAD(P)H-dependent FMN reductase